MRGLQGLMYSIISRAFGTSISFGGDANINASLFPTICSLVVRKLQSIHSHCRESDHFQKI